MKWMSSVPTLLAFVIVLAACSSSLPGSQEGSPEKADLYVSESTGSDANDGTTSATPFKTITKAVSIAASAQTIQVLPGIYDVSNGEAFPIFLPAGVSMVGDEPNKGNGATPTTIAGGGTGAAYFGYTYCIELGQGSTLKGFTVAATAGTLSGSVIIRSNNVTVRNCSIVGIDPSTTHNGIYIYNNSMDDVITANIIQNNNLGLGFIGGGVGSKVESNTIENNTYGVEYDSEGGDLGGGSAGSAGGNHIAQNTGNDLWTSTSGITIYAENNYWDHTPPTEGTASEDIYVDSGVTGTTIHTNGYLLN